VRGTTSKDDGASFDITERDEQRELETEGTGKKSIISAGSLDGRKATSLRRTESAVTAIVTMRAAGQRFVDRGVN